MAIVNIDPVTRLEGALSIAANVEDGQVTDAWTVATMYRGIEQLLLGRDPRDAPVITGRVCGVCHNVHRSASTRALENAFGVEGQIPEGALRLRNLEAGIEYVYDHALHTVALAGPDYSLNVLKKDGVDTSSWPQKHVETAEAFNFLTGKVYKEAVVQQRKMHTCLAILGGRGVFNLLWVPGGVGQGITPELVAKLLTRIKEVQTWVDTTLVPHVANLEEILVEHLQAYTFGQGLENYLAYGFMDNPTDPGKLIVGSGVRHSGSDFDFDQKNVGETIAHSWYNGDMGNQDSPVYIGDEPTPHPDTSAIDMKSLTPSGDFPKYSWGKGTRYNLNGSWVPLEVGPLARLVVNRKTFGNPLDLRLDASGNPSDTSGNTLSRVMARVQETLWLIGAPSLGLEGQLINWLLELDPKMDTALPEAPNILKDGTYKGFGTWEAPRGALGHWATIKDKKIDLYNIIAPTTWNVSPRDHNDQKGPIETALIGVPVPNDSDGKPILTNIGRTVRSFDPCLACTVHVFDRDKKKKYSIKIR